MAFIASIAKDKGAIKKKSGGIWLIAASTDSGPSSSLAAGDWGDLGYVKVNKISDKTEQLKDFDESGSQVVDELGNRTVELDLTLMQTDKALLDFIKETSRGNYYCLYHYNGVVNGKYQEELYPICKITPDIDRSSDEEFLPIKVSILKNDAAITFGTTGNAALPTGKHATSAIISLGTYWGTTETAVS
jgi:hypothetical protein